ncbi:MAG: hypothetical protein KL787_11075 [Taibaiella sp.]|nr:hypothetical protein [Taibaiella sp.]
MNKRLLLSCMATCVLWGSGTVQAQYKLENGSNDQVSEKRTSSINNWNVPKVPRSVQFAGEKVPLDRWEVYERLDRELLTNAFYHTSTFYIFKT